MLVQLLLRSRIKMSIKFIATRGNTTEEFSGIWTTPPSASKKIVDAPDPLAAYCAWVNSITPLILEPVYAHDDPACLSWPVSWVPSGHGVDHINKFKTWARCVKSRGLAIKVEEC